MITKIDTWQKNDIFLRRKNKVILEPGKEELPLSYIASFLKNLEGLGFSYSPALIERMQTLSEEDLFVFFFYISSLINHFLPKIILSVRRPQNPLGRGMYD